jgi:hypothetical protein
MAHMLTEEELATRIQRAVRAARNMEREAIVGFIQDFADSALGNGEIAIADRLVQVIEFVRGSVAVVDSVTATAELQTGEAVTEAELPPAREIRDEDEIAHLLRRVPPTSHGMEATLPLPRD